MKTRLFALSATAAALFVATPAAAQSFAEWTAGNWTVYEFEGECWMVSKNGTDTEISVGVSHADPDFYVSAGKPDWSTATTGQPYPVRVTFGSIDRRSTGMGLEGRVRGVGAISTGTAQADLALLMKAPTLTVYYANDSYAVALDRAALAQFSACVVTIGGIGS